MTQLARERSDVDAAGPVLTGTSVRTHVRDYFSRVKAGDTGSLPVVAGLIILATVFQIANQNFLTPGNLVNLLVQGAVYMLLALGMSFVLLIGEIDLSIGFVGGVGGVTVAVLVFGEGGSPWWIACICGLLATAAIGFIQGMIIALVKLPSFVVTLGGLLAWNGVMLMILGNGGGIPINNEMINNIANGLLPRAAGWVLMAVLVLIYAADTLIRDRHRRASGNATNPFSFTLFKLAAVAVAGVIVVAICDTDRGLLIPIQGVPWVLVIVLGFTVLWGIVLKRTAFGAHIYAVGGNPEAARRAGIRVDRIRIAVFTISGLMGGAAGIIYASRLRSVSANLDGGTLVLYCIAAAVIGGTSLFGGHGRALNAVLGGLVIAAIDNGMGLLGLSAATRLVVTGIVLVVAVTVDAIARRGRASSGVS